MKRTILSLAVNLVAAWAMGAEPADSLVWADEFDVDGAPNPEFWTSEVGFVRNQELQWYQPENAYCHGGLLIIEAREEHKPNPSYDSESTHWGAQRPDIECTSGSIQSAGKFEFLYGRLEVRARIPVLQPGAWPAIWTKGNSRQWPSNGEIDLMEYYPIKGVPHILANAVWGSDRPYIGRWDSEKIPYSHFLEQDSLWGEKFHIWEMEWTPEEVRLSLDGELLNVIDLTQTINGKAVGEGINPFHEPQYVILNLAIGGQHGGAPDYARYPLRYEVDYVRLYQK